MNKTLKKALSIIITILMIVTAVPMAIVPASAAEGVSYIDESGATQVCTEYTSVSSSVRNWTSGWYVLDSNQTFNGEIYANGEVHLILMDGCTLSAKWGGINVSSDGNFTIYGQGNNTGTIYASPDSYSDRSSGIGGDISYGSATFEKITINGGTIYATGGSCGAGIGSSTRGGILPSKGQIVINGGNIIAKGGDGAAGIGSGHSLSISVTINGGNITANGGSGGAGIGGGYGGLCQNTHINGGFIKATGGYGAAGIGNGQRMTQGWSFVNITGGIVVATGGSGASAIGANDRGYISSVNMGGGVVFENNSGKVLSDTTIDRNFTIEANQTLNIPADKTLTVAEGVTLTNKGTITNNGTITVQEGGTLINNGVIVQNGILTNNGTFTCTHSVIDDKWTTIEGTHYRECLSGCGGKAFEGACFGGVGTCLEGGICADCGAVYLPKNPDNHVTEDTYIEYINDINHGLYHSCCKALIQEIPHSPAEGQEATCAGVAVCADCGFAYGGNDATNHASDELKYVSNGKGTHILTHACCNNPAAAAEGHNMKYTVNGELTVDGVCEDCGDTGSVTLTPTAGGTYNGYAFISEYSGTGILGGLDAFTKPVISGCCEDGCADAGEHTVTMTLGDQSVSSTFTVTPKELTITQLRASSKEYDGNSVVGIIGLDLEGIVVYKEGDYPDDMWDDIHDDVSLSYNNLLCTVDDVVPGTYETAKLSGVALEGNDANNYVIAESLENVPLKDSVGYAYTIITPIIHLEALDQFLVGDAELDQNEYVAEGLREQFTIEGVLLYESGTFIEVDIDNIVISFNGEDVTEYFEIWTYSGILSRVCEGHEFDEKGFCSTGKCNSYEPPNKIIGENEWGLEIEYYAIYNAGNLYWFAEQVNTYGNNGIIGRLVADITVNEDLTAENLRQWTPIGGGYTPYTGDFDGQGHTISGLYFNDPEATMVGLFGYTDYAYIIKDVHLSNSYFKADSYIGALIGSSGSIVTDCTVDSTVTVEGESYMGGMFGYASGGELKNSLSTATISAPDNSKVIGGLVGYSCATVSNCYTTFFQAVDQSHDGGSVSNCYYLSDTETEDGGKTAEQFASGEVAYLIQSGVVAEEVYDDEGNYVESVTPHVWGQEIGTDDYPVLGGDKVYLVTNCKNENDYSNENINNAHDWSDKSGVCANGCGTKAFNATNGLVADNEKNILSGIAPGTVSLDGYTEILIDGLEWTYENGIGTGCTVTLVNENEIVAEYVILIYGDVNGDSWYDGQDAVIVSCLINGMLAKEDAGEAVYTAADCNHDGVIDEADVALLNEAGALLTNVDQSKPTEVLLETSAEYVEYLDLIDQSFEIDAEDETDTTEVDVDTTPEQDVKVDIFEMIMNFIKSIFEMLFAYIPVTFK